METVAETMSSVVDDIRGSLIPYSFAPSPRLRLSEETFFDPTPPGVPDGLGLDNPGEDNRWSASTSPATSSVSITVNVVE